MDKTAISLANELINARTDYVGDGMDGYVVLTLIDDQGFPTSSTITLSKAQGTNWLSFLSTTDTNKALRIANNNKASVCLASNNYNINLVGTVEIITEPIQKRPYWQDIFTEHYGSYDDPKTCVIKFTTQRYSVYFATEEAFEEGKL